jgi:tRNA 2-thiouridine synthesizing protein A
MLPEGDAEISDAWDAGDMGCGELVLELRGRLLTLPPDALFRLVARDPGAPEDLPAWCRMTRHVLVSADHPTYVIRRRRDG